MESAFAGVVVVVGGRFSAISNVSPCPNLREGQLFKMLGGNVRC